MSTAVSDDPPGPVYPRQVSLRAALTLVVGLVVVGLIGYVAVLASQARQPPQRLEIAAVAPTVASAPGEPAPAAVPAPRSAVTTVDPAWVATTAAKAGVPAVALQAYAAAQLAAPKGCGLGWTTLAGIGWVESHHGTIEGRTLSEAGFPSSPITGIPLGELDRAYGPMQFIPSTWATWGVDADGDGAADPQDINDAALAAAHYLCASGSLATGRGWADAVFSYNHSQDYVNQVYAAAQAYAARTR